MMAAMTSRPSASKVLLLAEPRVAIASAAAPIRRYRIARLRLDGRQPTTGTPAGRIKRA
jgi:hypothetical protein